MPGVAAAHDRAAALIETGSHVVRVENVFDDPGRGRLVTTLTEGSVRFWDVRTGALQRTLWLPMADGRN
jgi:hypothetical protein